MMNQPARRDRGRSVAEMVTTELRRSIVSGDLAPGATFALREISVMLGVSLMPVREALRNLETEGLVITRPGRSAQVTPLHLDDLRAVYRLRRSIEAEVAGRACLLLPAAELDRLQAQAGDFGDERHTIATIYDAHHAFHAALLAPAATAWDLRILNALGQAAERYIRIGFSKTGPRPDDNPRRQRAHEDLIDAFRLRDPAAAAAAVRAHLAGNEQAALHALNREPGEATA